MLTHINDVFDRIECYCFHTHLYSCPPSQSLYTFKKVTWCVRSFQCSFVCSFVRLASVRVWSAFTLTVHINALHNESVHRREEHASWINTIPLKIATLLNLQSLKWAYSFRTDVLIVSATSRHYSVLKRHVAPDVSQLLRCVTVDMIHIHHSSDHTYTVETWLQHTDLS